MTCFIYEGYIFQKEEGRFKHIIIMLRLLFRQLFKEVKLFCFRYKELGVKVVWTYTKEIPELVEYFPNFNKDEYPDRAYLWGILGTLREEA